MMQCFTIHSRLKRLFYGFSVLMCNASQRITENPEEEELQSGLKSVFCGHGRPEPAAVLVLPVLLLCMCVCVCVCISEELVVCLQ